MSRRQHRQLLCPIHLQPCADTGKSTVPHALLISPFRRVPFQSSATVHGHAVYVAHSAEADTARALSTVHCHIHA
jgi:hypothetical protein